MKFNGIEFKDSMIIFITIFFSWTSYSHGGRTNSSGCHNNSKTGGYHCHGGSLHKANLSSRIPNASQKQDTLKNINLAFSNLKKKSSVKKSTKDNSICSLRKLLQKTEAIYNLKNKVKRLQEKSIFFEKVESKCGLLKKMKLDMYFLERRTI